MSRNFHVYIHLPDLPARPDGKQPRALSAHLADALNGAFDKVCRERTCLVRCTTDAHDVIVLPEEVVMRMEELEHQDETA